ncbi:type II toxin-antitoxin system VapC family toxin [Brevundimonas balnearis]|uniref:Ribonuclease VapC n=1 Tax=Brevundimonas balnearis TaxID=1572858 RepID=A0ABV6R6T4_9CAUL
MFSLDSSTAIDFLRHPPPSLIERMGRARDAGELHLSSIVLFELSYGAERRVHPTHMDRLRTFLQGGVAILDFDADDAWFAGELRASMERQGGPIGPYDTLIAAQALRRDLTLVTANTREFGRVPALKLENWRA